MNTVPVLDNAHQSRSACAVISGPLSILKSSGAPPLAAQPLQRRDDRVGVDAARHQHHQRLARELIDDVHQLQRPPVGGLVELKIERPHVIRPLGPQPLRRDRRLPQPPALTLALRAPAALLAPQPLHPLAVRPPSPPPAADDARGDTPTAAAPPRTSAAPRATPRHPRPAWARDAAWSDAARPPDTPSAR